MKGMYQIHIFLLMTVLLIIMLPSPVWAGTDVVLARTGDQSEPAIAVGPLDSGLVLAGSIDIDSAGQGLGLNYFVSRDGGVTWPTRGLIPKVSGKTFHADPTIAFDRSGNAWYGGVAFSKGGGDKDCDMTLFVTKNTGDLSGSWTEPEIIMLGGPFPDGGGRFCHDKPSLAVDNSGYVSGKVAMNQARNYDSLGRQEGLDVFYIVYKNASGPFKDWLDYLNIERLVPWW